MEADSGQLNEKRSVTWLVLFFLLTFPIPISGARTADVMGAVAAADQEVRDCQTLHPDRPYRWCEWKFNYDHWPLDSEYTPYAQWINEIRWGRTEGNDLKN